MHKSSVENIIGKKVATKMPYKFSPSSLSLMKDCPRCFWLHFNKGIKRPRGIFPSLPSGMDKILKNHFDNFRAKGELPPEIKAEKIDVELFKDLEVLNEWRNVFKGIKWEDKDGNILKGAVDEILQKGKKLIVLDYKTRGYPCKEDTHKHYQDQLDFYNFLLRKNGHDTEDYAYLFFYIPQKVNAKGDFVFDVEVKKMEIDVGNAERIMKKAIKLLDGEMPESSEECEYCKLKNN